MRSYQGITERYLKYMLLVLIGLLVGVTYGRGLTNSFVAEDFTMMSLSTLQFSDLWEFVTSATRLRPLPVYINWVLYHAFGMNPLGYHLFVLFLHVVSSVLVFVVGKLLTGDERVGLISALFFAVYPRHHQSVLWLAADQFVMVGVWVLISILCFRAYLRTGRLGYQLGTLVCVCMALLTNELGVILFPLLFLMEFVVWGSEQEKRPNFFAIRTYYKYIPYLILLVFYVGITFGGDRLFKLSSASGVQRVATEGWGYDTYHLMLGPSQVKDLVAYLTYVVYPHIPLRSLDVGLMTGMLSGFTLLFFFLLLVKGQVVVRFLILWTGLAVLPFVLFVPFGNAGRYFYVSAIGFSLLEGVIGCWAYDKVRARSATVAQIAAVLVGGVYLTSSVVLMQQRINEWRHAGEVAADIVEQAKRLYPGVPEGSTMLFVALPGQYEQAYIFLGGGIGGAIDLAYRDQSSSPSAYQTRHPEVVSFLKDARPVNRPLSGLYVFLYADGVLLDKTDVVDGLEPLQESTWFR